MRMLYALSLIHIWFNPVAYLFAAAMLAPFIWIARKLYYRPAKLKAMQAKYETMGEYRKLLGQCLFWLYITGSFASFFIIAEQKNHSKEQPLIERLQAVSYTHLLFVTELLYGVNYWAY